MLKAFGGTAQNPWRTKAGEKMVKDEGQSRR